SPGAWDVATGVAAHSAAIAWIIAAGILPLFAMVGFTLHSRHRARLLEVNAPPLKDRELAHRLYDVKALEARRGWLPQSFTYSPHMRNDVLEAEEAPTPALPGPILTAEQALSMEGIVYGERLDGAGPLVEHRVLSLAIGGRPGSGKTSTAVLL